MSEDKETVLEVVNAIEDIGERNKLQSIMSKKLFDESDSEMGEALKAIEEHGTAISERQLAAVAYLEILGNKRRTNVYRPIINALTSGRSMLTGPEAFQDVINSVTKGDILTGKVRANNYFKNDGNK